ncbi:MAG: hypothetical protein ACON4O_09130 [Lentimonas sp.]
MIFLVGNEPEKLANWLQLLLDGSVIVAQADGGLEIVDTVRDLAKIHIQKACN